MADYYEELVTLLGAFDEQKMKLLLCNYDAVADHQQLRPYEGRIYVVK